jgi:hypothetical protein
MNLHFDIRLLVKIFFFFFLIFCVYSHYPKHFKILKYIVFRYYADSGVFFSESWVQLCEI